MFVVSAQSSCWIGKIIDTPTRTHNCVLGDAVCMLCCVAGFIAARMLHIMGSEFYFDVSKFSTISL